MPAEFRSRTSAHLCDRDGAIDEKKGPLWTRNFSLITLANFLVFAGFHMMGPSMPIYIKRLGGSNVMAGLFWGSFTTASTGVRPVAGRLLDLFSRRTVFLVGLPIMILSVLSYRWTSSMTVLLVLGFTQGLGFGSTNTAAGTIAADLIPKPRLGEGMGFFALAATTAMALGPVTGLFIITRLSFSTLFYVSAATSCCAFVLGYLIRYRSFHRQDPDRMRDPVSNEPRRMSVFELRAVGPSLVMFFTNTVFGAVVTFIALYALEEGITNIGPFFTVYAAALALTRPLSGIVSDRLGTDVVVVPGLVLVAASMVVLSYANTLSIFLGAGIIFGLGFGAILPSMQALAVGKVPPNRRGAATGTFFMGFDLGIGAGAVLWGLVSSSIGYSRMYLATVIPVGLAFLSYLAYRSSSNSSY